MDEEYLDPDFDYWSFDEDYVREEPTAMAAWKYEGRNSYEDDLRVRVTAEIEENLVIPPYQFFASEIRRYTSPEEAYLEAVEFVQDFDVETLGENTHTNAEGDAS